MLQLIVAEVGAVGSCMILGRGSGLSGRSRRSNVVEQLFPVDVSVLQREADERTNQLSVEFRQARLPCIVKD